MNFPWQERLSQVYKASLKTIFMGTPQFSVPVLQLLHEMPEVDLVAVVCQPDKPVGRKKVLTTPPVGILAKELGLPLFQPNKLTDAKAEILAFGADLFIVEAYGKLLPEWALNAPKIAPINLHASLLPKYRGAGPIQAAILNQEVETGITFMGMESEMDAGPILFQQAIPIEPNDTTATLTEKLSHLAANVCKEGLGYILNGSLTVTPQATDLVTFAGKVNRETAQIDWHQSATAVDAQVRAMLPQPGPWTTWQNNPTKIHQGYFKANTHGMLPGTIQSLASDKIAVACQSDVYVIEQIQPAGKKTMSSEDFIRGYQPKVGDVFTMQDLRIS